MNRQQLNNLSYLSNNIIQQYLLEQKIDRMRDQLANLKENKERFSTKFGLESATDQQILALFAKQLPEEYAVLKERYENKIDKVNFGQPTK